MTIVVVLSSLKLKTYYPLALPLIAFNPAFVVENEIEIWVKIHVHVFLDDNCEGNFTDWPGASAVAQHRIYNEINTLFDDANALLGNLEPTWSNEAGFGVPQATENPFMPIRYYLDGVSVHCDASRLNDGTQFRQLQSDFGIPGMLNMFITESPGGAGGYSWYHQPAFTSENFSPITMIHETMHNFGVRHAVGNDDIDDTPDKQFDFDYNLDGDKADNFPDQTCDGVGLESSFVVVGTKIHQMSL